MTVELGLTPDSRWDIDTPGLLEAARRAGFTALGISNDRVDRDTASLFEAAGMRCHELLALVVSDDEASTIPWAERLAEKAAMVGAPWVLTVFRSGLSDETAKIIQRSAAIFAEAGARMAVEFSPMGPITSIAAGL